MSFKKRPAIPGVCPCCGGALAVTELRCGDCGVVLRGEFSGSAGGGGILSLGSEDLAFAELFLRCSGNLRELQAELGQSYPTIKKQLDRVVAALNASKPAQAGKIPQIPRGGAYAGGNSEAASVESDDAEKSVIEAMRGGKLTVDEAVAEINRLKNAGKGGK